MWFDFCFFAAAARVVIERATYEVKEKDRTFRVCARVRSQFPVSENCHLDFTFNVRLVPTPGTASEDATRIEFILQLHNFIEPKAIAIHFH